MKGILQPPESPGNPSASTRSSDARSGFDVVDLKQYFHIVVKRIWLVALCFAMSLAVMVVIMVQQVPVYGASATLLLSSGLPLPSRLRQTDVQPLGSGDYIITQQRIISSNIIKERARERLGLSGAEYGQLTNVRVDQLWKTSMLRISVEALEPKLAADYANALAEEYLDFKAEERMDTSQATVISLTQQANRLREELKRAEERVLTFEKENKVIAIRERGNIAADYLAKLSSQAASYKTERMLLEAQQPLISEASDEIVLATLASPIGLSYSSAAILSGGSDTNAAVPYMSAPAEGLIEHGVVSQPGWQQLRRQKSRLEAELNQLRAKFRDAHPRVQEVLTALKNTERELDVELQFALNRYYANLESLTIKEKAAQRVETAWEDQALDVARKSHEYSSLQRSVKRLQGLYDLIFNRLKEVDVSIGIEPEAVQIMERARIPSNPIRSRNLQNIFIAALIGLGVGLGLVFGLEYIDDSLRYPEEVTRGLGLPFFGVIPSASWDPDDLSTHILTNIDQKSGLAEAYRNVRSAFMFSGADEYIKSIVVTSAVPKEGKTTTCMNMGVSLAQAGSRILMIDADMRRGELHKYFGLEAGRGFSEVLVGQAKPEAVIQRTSVPNLDLIATGPFPPNPAELILRPELNAFMDYAKRSYDKILFDCPPVMAVSEAAIMCSLVDGVVFVVWAGQTSRKLSQLAVQVLRERGSNMLGCILNNLEFGRVGYYYYSTYYGYYDYDYHYGPGGRTEVETQ
jgi:capsular exopolysaccharide synthesis family protein